MRNTQLITTCLIAATLSAGALSGCANGFLPKAHRHAMQQGNMIERASIDKLENGMSTEQVRYLLGNPVIANVADAQTWLYTFAAGTIVEPSKPQLLAVKFANDVVTEIEDNYQPAGDLDAYRAQVNSDFD